MFANSFNTVNNNQKLIPNPSINEGTTSYHRMIKNNPYVDVDVEIKSINSEKSDDKQKKSDKIKAYNYTTNNSMRKLKEISFDSKVSSYLK